jgi:uncharacterized protein YbjT (DUF2867 family)
VNELIVKGQKVRLVARSADRLRPFVGKKADAMSGDALDTEFLVQAFKGADSVFTLIPPNISSDDYLSFAGTIGESIAKAIQISGISHVVNLSSVGGELAHGTGPIVGLHFMEKRLDRIEGLNVLHIRSAYFMENFLADIGMINSKKVIAGTLPGDFGFPMIATKDVAAYAAMRLIHRDFSGSSVQYLLGKDDFSMNDAAMIIGKKINQPGLSYKMISPAAEAKLMRSIGISRDVSGLYLEMNQAFSDGRIRNEERSSRNSTGTSFEQFCDEVFVPAYREGLKKAA